MSPILCKQCNASTIQANIFHFCSAISDCNYLVDTYVAFYYIPDGCLVRLSEIQWRKLRPSQYSIYMYSTYMPFYLKILFDLSILASFIRLLKLLCFYPCLPFLNLLLRLFLCTLVSQPASSSSSEYYSKFPFTNPELPYFFSL